MGVSREAPSPPDGAQFLEMLRKITEASQIIMETVPKVKTAVEGTKTVQKEIERAQCIQASDLADLKEDFYRCTIKAKRYVFACVALAKFVDSDEMVSILERDLQTGYVVNLKEYINQVIKLISECLERLNRFNHTFETVNKKADSYMKEYEMSAQKSRQSAEPLKPPEPPQPNPKTNLARKVLGSTLALSAAGGFVGASLMSQGYLTGRMAAITMGGCAISGAASWGMERYLENKQALGQNTGGTEDNANGFKNAQTKVAQMIRFTDRTAFEVGEIEALRDHASSILKSIYQKVHKCEINDVIVVGIRQEITDLRRVMREILTQTGQKGEKVSIQPLQLMRNKPSQAREDSPKATAIMIQEETTSEDELLPPTEEASYPFKFEIYRPRTIDIHPNISDLSYDVRPGPDFDQHPELPTDT